ncbi:glutamate receptor ionotropic, delta-2-like [Palaemon carinicauda]|uniref:glutamate receptor ionotropic, delta-2-like n=1 Tax=Palaemon carinicauda TaxID=392227 RepID=UPI0035B6AB16
MEVEGARNSIATLEDLVNEGTQVTICLRYSAEHWELLLPRVDSGGIVRFPEKDRYKSATTDTSTTSKYYSLSGRQMKIAVKGLMLTVTLGTTYPDGSVEVVSGAEGFLLKTLSSTLNFTFQAFLPKDQLWGNLLPDGSVTGIIGMVARREAHVAISALAMSESREKVTDFAWIFQNYPSLLISRSPKEKNKALSALSPFQLKVWLFLIVSVLSMGPFVYTISYLVNRYLTYDAQNDIQWYAFNMFRIIVNQGIFIRERSWPIRAILSFYLIFCIVFSVDFKRLEKYVIGILAFLTD